MRMSCNGCRVLRKGCSENCSIRPCLEWIKNAESQANATVFLAKFYGRAGLTSLINTGPQHLRPAIFRSLLYEACGRMVNPIYGAVGLLWSGNWQTCQAAVESILKGCPIHPMIAPAEPFTSTGNQITEQNNNNNKSTNLLPPSALMQSIANELQKVKTKGRFKHPKKASKLPKDIAHILPDAEAASEVCNLQWGRSYPGEESDAPHCLVSSDSSSESEHHHCNDVRESRAGFEPETKDLVTQQELVPHAECESDLELELTLCCHSPVVKQSNIPCL